MMAQCKPGPWDYEAFVRHYNEFARDFARTRFQIDRQTQGSGVY